MMKILIAQQDETPELFEFVKNHNWQQPVALHVVHVIEMIPATMAGYSMGNQMITGISNYAQEVAVFAREKLRQLVPDIDVTVSTPTGRPADCILDIAESWGADAIVIGTHGRGFFGRVFLGSVSLAVVSQSKCSVFIVSRKFLATANAA